MSVWLGADSRGQGVSRRGVVVAPSQRSAAGCRPLSMASPDMMTMLSWLHSAALDDDTQVDTLIE